MKTLNIITALAFVFGANYASAQGLPNYKLHNEDFAYSQQTSVSIIFQQSKAAIRAEIGPILDKLGLEVASWEDDSLGYLILKPMVFTGEFGGQSLADSGMASSTEVEFDVLVYPKSKGQGEGPKTFKEYLKGGLSHSLVGQLRLDVLCDNAVAVAAGRVKFGEHKYLAPFEYTYSTANNTSKKNTPFSLDFSAYTSVGSDQASRKIFNIKANLEGLKAFAVVVPKELLYSSFPQETDSSANSVTMTNFRQYGSAFQAFLPDASKQSVSVSFGNAQGGQILTPVAPIADGQPIPGSDKWPTETRDRMSSLLTTAKAAGFLLYQPLPVEYEVRPVPVK